MSSRMTSTTLEQEQESISGEATFWTVPQRFRAVILAHDEELAAVVLPFLPSKPETRDALCHYGCVEPGNLG